MFEKRDFFYSQTSMNVRKILAQITALVKTYLAVFSVHVYLVMKERIVQVTGSRPEGRGYSGYQVTGIVEWGQKSKPQKIPGPKINPQKIPWKISDPLKFPKRIR